MVNRSIKQLTIQWMTFLNMTASERTAKKLAKKEQSLKRDFYSNKWLGTLPYMWRLLFKVK